MTDPLPIFIGWDSREQQAYEACRSSLVRHSSVPLRIMPLKHRALRQMGLFDRPWRIDEKGQYWDERDGLPFSTEFSFTRFLVPDLAEKFGITGWALFVDCDFLFRSDVAELFALADPDKSIMCVQHDHRPRETIKMDGMRQSASPRKNWSSLVLWNLHRCHPDSVSVGEAPGPALHSFACYQDDDLGALPLSWNWLCGYNDPLPPPGPDAVHYTLGTPDMDGYENQPYAAEWWLRAMGHSHGGPA